MSSGLTIRRPAFNFVNAEVIWSANPECSMVWNAMSTSAAIVEPWLNKIMTLCGKQIGTGDSETLEMIDDFVRQESNHYRIHIEFNRRLAERGFSLPKEMAAKLRDELRDQANNRSLAFNAAYCAGFENFTLFTSKFMFENAGDLFMEGDRGGSDLWLWHMAEEFEHRSVCHNVFAVISGNYFIRVWGLIYSFVHLNRHVGAAVKEYLETYRKGMTEAERAESIRREKSYNRRYSLYAFPRMLAILVPFYNPGRAKASPKLSRALERYSAMSA